MNGPQDTWPADWAQQLHDGLVADAVLAEVARTVTQHPDPQEPPC